MATEMVLGNRGYVTRILNHKAPVFKLFEQSSCVEVDFCVNNDLGIRNTGLLRAYVAYDARAGILGRAVKEWVSSSGLVGIQDGMLLACVVSPFLLRTWT
jgi:DNA polymerase sigma